MKQDITKELIRERYKVGTEEIPEENPAAEVTSEEEKQDLPDDIVQDREQEDYGDGDTAADVEEPEAADKESESSYDFLNEKIKKQPFSWKRFGISTVKYILAGLVIGAVACLVFYALTPWASERFAKDETVTIEEDIAEETVVMVPVEEEETEEEKEILNEESYQEMMTALQKISADASKSLVTIVGESDQTEWFDGTYTEPRSASGLIVAETNGEIMILGPAFLTEGSTHQKVIFGDQAAYPAELKKADRNTKLAVFTVQKSLLNNVTNNYYTVANLGNSYSIAKGNAILALGSPLGLEGGAAQGILSSKNGPSVIRDGDYQLLVSDITGISKSSGVFFNLTGEAVGIIIPEVSKSPETVLTAISISDIKAIIEKLSNGKAIPYLGIDGMDIDAATAESQNVKQGILITDLDMDGPALAGGLQVGDIIYQIGGEDAMTLQTLRSIMLEKEKDSTIEVHIYRASPEGYDQTSFQVTLSALE